MLLKIRQYILYCNIISQEYQVFSRIFYAQVLTNFNAQG